MRCLAVPPPLLCAVWLRPPTLLRALSGCGAAPSLCPIAGRVRKELDHKLSHLSGPLYLIAGRPGVWLHVAVLGEVSQPNVMVCLQRGVGRVGERALAAARRRYSGPPLLPQVAPSCLFPLPLLLSPLPPPPPPQPPPPPLPMPLPAPLACSRGSSITAAAPRLLLPRPLPPRP